MFAGANLPMKSSIATKTLMESDRTSQHIGNLAGALKVAPRFIQVRRIGPFYKTDPTPAAIR